MTTDRTPPPPHGPRDRDAGARRVTRVGYGVAAAAVLGTAVFGGLAASSHQSATTSGAAATAAASTPSAGVTAQSASAPAATAQTPVASSGGS